MIGGGDLGLGEGKEKEGGSEIWLEGLCRQGRDGEWSMDWAGGSTYAASEPQDFGG